jgi:HK97 family phage portal protein
MSLISRLAGFFRQKMTPDDWLRDFGDWNESATGINVTQMRAMQASAVMACVSILSEDLAKLPLHVKRTLGDGSERIVKDHPIERLLQKPSDLQNRFEFVEMMQAALLLRGNAYAPIVRDGRGQPKALIAVNPDSVTPFESPDGSRFFSVSRNTPYLMAALQSLPQMIHSDDMLHVRWLSLHGPIGISRIGFARESIGLSLAQERQAAKLAGNGARPGGVLQTDQKMTKEGIERLRAQWNSTYGGVDETGKTAVLEQGVKWQALGMTSLDAEFLASRRFQVEEIARLFRMPLHKLGVVEALAKVNMVQADQDYQNNIISPYAERWEAKVDDTFGLAADGVFVEFDLERFLRADILTRYNANRVAIIGMFKTPNEVRRGEGLPDVKGGETLYQPTNVAPIGFTPTGAETGPGSDVTGAPAAGGSGDPAAVEPVSD